MAMHYETIPNKFGQCPSSIAVGPNDTGKTTTAKSFLPLARKEEKCLARQRLKCRNVHRHPFHMYLMI
jgi:hypothetical protein